ncbi:MarR family transcriptional regulator [Salinibacterium sp.]|uniref:MarR family winged helix-turn-helix transcriptional regulator n=1 Tax=Salinibacterium sp. TaxID=1915057 RepID=UPI00286B7B39|nr:MarR family transcriptional regulator [Salinibacterium sp.]
MITVDGILAQWSRERPDLDVSPMAVVGRLSRVNALFEAGLSADYAQWGLDGGCFDVLFTLVRSGAPHALSPSALAASSMVSTAAVAQRVNRLVAAGLVTRKPDPRDGRGTVVSLTAAGKHLADRALPSHLQAEERLLVSLSAADRAHLAALLEKVLTATATPR